MHALIGISVKATNHDEAVDQAEDYFNDRLLNNYGIDWGVPVEDGERYDNIPVPCPVLSPKGIAFADRCMENTRDAFYESMKIIRKGLEAISDEDLWKEDNYELMLRYHMNQAGAYGGHAIRLYDESWGEGVRDAGSYDKVQMGWNDDTSETWIVPMDIHY
tara:strand:+ start:772 stop:1254 length:483 start_codon:yes stop_codon:yes gene_type:complete